MTTLCVNDPERGDYAVFETCSTLKSNIPHIGHAFHSRPSSYTRHRHVQTGAECAIVTRRPRQLYRWIPSHRLAFRLVLPRHLVQCERYHHRTRPYTQNTAAERQDTTQGLDHNSPQSVVLFHMLQSRTPMPSLTKAEDVEAKYDVALNCE